MNLRVASQPGGEELGILLQLVASHPHLAVFSSQEQPSQATRASQSFPTISENSGRT